MLPGMEIGRTVSSIEQADTTGKPVNAGYPRK
jgi:hypothetical protein